MALNLPKSLNVVTYLFQACSERIEGFCQLNMDRIVVSVGNGHRILALFYNKVIFHSMRNSNILVKVISNVNINFVRMLTFVVLVAFSPIVPNLRPNLLLALMQRNMLVWVLLNYQSHFDCNFN